jgi:hypothetical protein
MITQVLLCSLYVIYNFGHRNNNLISFACPITLDANFRVRKLYMQN